jgi:predicted deacylase
VLLMAGNHGDEFEGQVVCARVPGRVERGDCLFHLAAEPTD